MIVYNDDEVRPAYRIAKSDDMIHGPSFNAE